MKNLIFILLCLFFASCQQHDNAESITDTPCAACGVKDARNIPWLKELIGKAENDKTGNYVGTMWLVNYHGQDIFVTNMMFGSGGIKYWYFDCAGNHLISKSGEGGYCPSEYVGKGHFVMKDATDFYSFILNLCLGTDYEPAETIVVYSTLKFYADE